MASAAAASSCGCSAYGSSPPRRANVAIDARDRIVVAGAAYDDEYELRDDLGQSHPAVARLHG